MPILGYRNEQLCWQGVAIQRLADEVGTPFFLASEARLRANYHALARGLFNADVPATIRYCAKTNPEPSVLKILEACGCHVLASHNAEVQLALRSGFSQEKIAFQRPVLLEDEARAVVEAGASLVHLYHLHDLPIIEKAAAGRGQPVNISLRLRNDAPAYRFSPLNFLSRRMGLQESEILSAAERIRGSQWLNLKAINFHRGTQLGSVHNYRALLRRITRLAAKLESLGGVPLQEINLGGGIPSPSHRRVGLHTLVPRLTGTLSFDDSLEALEDFARELSAAYRDEATKAGLSPPPALAVEPGRSIVGTAAILVTRVRAVRGKWVFLDSSRNYLAESPFLFTRQILPALHQHAPTPKRFYHLSGSTLNTTDIIDLHRRLPPVVEGEVLAICDAGAYSISRASRYAGPSPPVYLIQDDGAVRMIRRAETLEDLTSTSVIDYDEERARDE
jgi:diaminopimelate decarboxylase